MFGTGRMRLQLVRRWFSSAATFLSDNSAGAPEPVVRALIEESRRGSCPAYGGSGDLVSAQAEAAVKRELLGGSVSAASAGDSYDAESRVFFVGGGTGANVVALSSVVDRHQSVLVSSESHVYRDECGAFERWSGSKLVPVVATGPGGKLTVDDLAPELSRGAGDVHSAQPRVLSLTQATEYGAVYSSQELAALTDMAHAHNLLVHVDGARLANAFVRYTESIRNEEGDGQKAASFRPFLAGVDLVSVGATKNGLLFGECVVLRPTVGQLALDRAPFVRKACGQLFSKQRFIAAQFLAYCSDGLWVRCAQHANDLASRLAHALQNRCGLQLTQPCDANLVFVALPISVYQGLTAEPNGSRELHWQFHNWTPNWSLGHHEVRLCCSFDTDPDDIDRLINDICFLLKK